MSSLWQNANIISKWGLLWKFIGIDWNMEKWKTDWGMTKFMTWAKELGGNRWQESVKDESLWIVSSKWYLRQNKLSISLASCSAVLLNTHTNYHIKLFLEILWSNNECVRLNMSPAKRCTYHRIVTTYVH